MRKPKLTGAMMEARGIYRRWLNKEYDRITLAGLAPDDQPLLLRKIYVPLVLTPERVPETVDENEIHAHGALLEEWMDRLDDPAGRLDKATYERPRPRPWGLQSLHDDPYRTLLISGEPGSGKTTLTQAVVASLSGQVLDSFNQSFKGYVPIPLTLRSVPLAHLANLEEMVEWWLGQVKVMPDEQWNPEELKRCIEEGYGIFLFDGLDELIGVEVRHRFLSAIRGHPWLVGERRNYALLTGRPSGYDGMRDELPPGLPLYVAPFSQGQIRTYLEHWFALRPMRTPGKEGTAESLLERLTTGEQRRRLLPLARRPAYLAALAFVHGTRGQLPHTRAELYELLVDAYLEVLDQKKEQERWSEDDEATDRARNWNRQDKLQVLSTVAFIAHRLGTRSVKEAKNRHPGTEPDLRFQWSKEELVETVELAIRDCRLREIVPEDAGELTDYFVARTGLLADPQEGVFQFAHLSFQEYLAALYLLDRAVEEEEEGTTKAEYLKTALLNDLLEGEGWQEVAMLVLAIDARRSQNVGHRALLQRLEPRSRAHCELLTRVLEGEEIRLAESERREWVAAWFGMVAIQESAIDGARLSRVWTEKRNRSHLNAAWSAVAAAVAEGSSPGEALRYLVRAGRSQTEASEGSERPSVLALASPRQDPKKAQRPREPLLERVGKELDTNDAETAIVVPLLVGWRPQEETELLLDILQQQTLFRTRAEEDRIHEPRRLWWVLVAWADLIEELVSPLVSETRFAWLMQDILLVDRFLGLLDSRVSGRKRWQRQLASAYDRLQLALSGRVLHARSDLKYSAQALQLLHDQAQACTNKVIYRYSGNVYYLSISQSPFDDFDRARLQVQSASSRRASGHALSLARDLTWRPRGQHVVLGGAGGLSAMVEALAPMISSEDLLTSDIMSLLNVWNEEEDSLQEGAHSLLAFLLTALALRPRLGFPRSLSRKEVLGDLEKLGSPELAAKPLDRETRQRAIEEHQEYLECPWSPLPMIEFMQEDAGWEEVDVSEEAIVGSFARRVKELRSRL